MKITLLIIALLLNIGGDLDKTSQKNHLRNQAREALVAEDYSKAALYYQKLVDDYQVSDPQTRLNLANAYFKSEEPEKARSQYAMLTSNTSAQIKASAHHQLGAIAFQEQNLEEALLAFKHALKANPYHEKAAYNYELVKKMLEQQEDQEDDQDDQENEEEQQDEESDKDNEGEQDDEGDAEDEEGEDSEEGESDEEEQDGEGDEQQDGEEQEDQSEQDDERDQQMQDRKQRFEEGDMTEEKAEMLLESMKNQEIQYMQQRKRTTEEDNYSGRPDW